MTSQSDPQPRTDQLGPASVPETIKLDLTRSYSPAGPSAARALPLREGSRFQVRQFHAQGGLGVVHLAEDLELLRSVAFKQIQPAHAENPDSRRRFLLEAEITGKLEHPGVVPVYGLVADERGQPAYAMRFIQGDTLADAIRGFHHGRDSVPLASPVPAPDRTTALAEPVAPAKPVAHGFTSVRFRQLLSRFVALCNTIAFAHSRGIIHRDIKPGNLMLGSYGESLVLDWGLARPFDHRTGIDPKDFADADSAADAPLRPVLSGGGAEHTPTGKPFGTPVYMSPEQAAGRWDVVGPAADVYSLGATLYTLLTGARPFDGRDNDEVLQAVRDGQFRAPREVNAHIPKPLAAICLKAMSLEPRARYASALALAEDIEHYLADEPVTAYRERFVERARRFGRKHRALVTSTSAAILVALFAFGIATWLLTAAYASERLARTEAETQRDRADGNLKRAKDAVEKYLTEVTDDPQLKQHDFHELRKRLLKTAVPFYEEFSRQEEHEPSRRADVGRAYLRLASIQSELDLFEEAETNYEQARAIFGAVVAEVPDEQEYRHGLAASHGNLAIVLIKLGKPLDAEQAFLKAIDIRKQLTVQFRDVPQHREDLGKGYHNLGMLQRRLGKRGDAEEACSRAIELREALAAQFPDVAQYRMQLAASYGRLGVLFADRGKHVEAERELGRAVQVQEALPDDFKSVPENRQELARTYINFGSVVSESGKYEEGQKAYSRAIKIQEGLVEQFPSVPDYRQELAISLYNLGTRLHHLRKLVEAESAYLRAIKLQEELSPSVPDYREKLAASHHQLGRLLRDREKVADAKKAYRRAAEILEPLAAQFNTVPLYRDKLADIHNDLGTWFQDLGQFAEAEKAHREAIKIRKQLTVEFSDIPQHQVALAGSYVNLGNTMSDSGRALESLDWYLQAIKRLESVLLAEPHLRLARLFLRNAHWGRADAFARLTRFAEAAADMESAMKLDDGSARPLFRMQRASYLARLDPPKAVAEAEALARGEKVPANFLYDLACVCSLAAANVKDEPLREQYAARAVDLLRQAVARGFKDAEHIKQDTDLDALRQRDDFRKLLSELESAAAKKTAKE